jgi:hypothetical protein
MILSPVFALAWTRASHVPGFTTTKTQLLRAIPFRILLGQFVSFPHVIYWNRITPCLVMVGSATTRCLGGGLCGLPGSRRFSGVCLPARPPQFKVERFDRAFYQGKDSVASIDHTSTNYRADFVFETLHIASEFIFLSDIITHFTINWRNFSE